MNRFVIAAVAALVLTGVAVGYVLLRPSAPAAQTSEAPGARLLVLTNGKVSTVDGGKREVTDESCDRSYTAAGTTSCLRPAGPLKATELAVLDSSLREKRVVPLTGFPNRTRVSPSGRMVAWTLFVDGHSYAANGFSTETGILDTASGTLVRSLEEFSATVDGKPHQAADINFWGVTFVDDNRFYATMSTGGHRYLVEGDFTARTVRTLADNVECPSLSPDGRRIAYKAAVDGDPNRGWRLSVMDLTTGTITPLSETRSIDDQPAWLDNATVAYATQLPDGTNEIWSARTDGTGTPARLVVGANSPAPLGG